METAEIVKGIVRETEPDAVIVVDALAARSAGRLGVTVQPVSYTHLDVYKRQSSHFCLL